MFKKIRLFLIIIIVVLAVSACNMPGAKPNPTPILFPTPNYTMTALFSQDSQIPPTITPPIMVISPTPPVEQATTVPTSEPTSVPTNTPVVVTATATATAKSVTPTNTQTIRGGTWVTAKYLSTAPTLDGVWDEWDTTKYPAAYVVYGANERKSAEDLEGSFRVGWNNDYLFVAVKVLDDKYVQNATGQDIYKGDSIEILFDLNLYGDLNSDYLSADDYQLGISPGKGGIDGEKEAFLWFPTAHTGGKSNVKIGSTLEDGIYRVEMAIPWSVLGVSSPASGQQYGFGLSVSDNDNSSENVQQSMVSNLPYRSLVDPTTWTLLILNK